MSETRIIRVEHGLGDVFEKPFSRDIYYCFRDNHPNPLIAHVCRDERVGREGQWRWSWRSTDAHTLVSVDPLHLEPSIGLMDCCGRHGFIRNGQWEPAGDEGGWRP